MAEGRRRCLCHRVLLLLRYKLRVAASGAGGGAGRERCRDKEKNAIQQTVTDLSADTTYELMGMFRVGKEANAGLAVVLGGKKTRSRTVGATHGKWRRRTLRFTTGPKQTSVTVIAEKLSAGGSLVYVDDMGLQGVD